nr:HGGxSTG domain-containing protein [Magnetospirillum fulvum]
MPVPPDHPLCGAKTRSGEPCRQPAMRNGRCRMHGGKSTGPIDQMGNQNARKHGVWSRLLTEEDREFLALPQGERLAILQGTAELRAFRAHKAAPVPEASPDDGDDEGKTSGGSLDAAFNRNARTAGALARTRVMIAQAAADGVALPGDQVAGDDDDAEAVTEDERTARLVAILDAGAAPGDGDPPGTSAVDTGQPAADRGPVKPG